MGLDSWGVRWYTLERLRTRIRDSMHHFTGRFSELKAAGSLRQNEKPQKDRQVLVRTRQR